MVYALLADSGSPCGLIRWVSLTIMGSSAGLSTNPSISISLLSLCICFISASVKVTTFLQYAFLPTLPRSSAWYSWNVVCLSLSFRVYISIGIVTSPNPILVLSIGLISLSSASRGVYG